MFLGGVTVQTDRTDVYPLKLVTVLADESRS